MLMKNRKSLLIGLGIFAGFIALITSPIWITILVLTSPVIIAGALLFIYTDLFNPLIKFGTSYMFTWFTQHYQKNDLVFLNGGFADLEAEDGLYIKTLRDKFDALRFQLYHYIVMRFGGVNNLNGLSLLETGCGRGGGLHYLARELNPQSALGLDHSQTQIDYCKKHWMSDKGLNLNFIKHDVEKMNEIVSRNTMDYIVDIDSSFFYPNKDAFYRQVSQALRKDGIFLYGTFVPVFMTKSFEDKLHRYFDIEKSEDITKEVLKSMNLDSKNVSAVIEANFPWWSQRFLKEAFGLAGTYFNKMMDNKVMSYKAYVLRRRKSN